jgi:hypothetical protein
VVSPALKGGTYTWSVLTKNPAGASLWSSRSFNTGTTLPLAAVLTEPTGNIGATFSPTYIWNKDATATHYELKIKGPGGVLVLDQWYTAASICPTSTCSVAGPTLKTAGTYTWSVLTKSPAGAGPWSSKSFSTTPPAAVPAAAVLTYPALNDNIGTNYNPIYTWNKNATATVYRLKIKGPGGVLVLDQWYSAVSICPAATCSVPGPTPTLGGGTYTWSVQTYNPAGYGPWSSRSFTTTTPTIPTGATLTAPIGTVTNATPAYQWNRVNMATWYRLYVKGPSGKVVLDKWVQAASVCNATTCSVLSPTTLENGDHIWWIQTNNSAGYGPWKSAAFKLSS